MMEERNFECEKYSECLKYGATKNIDLKCKDCKNMSNFLKPEKVNQVIEHIKKGNGIRKTSREAGISKNTVTSIQRVVVAEKIKIGESIPVCKCGQPVGHKGWCSHRFAESPKRQKFMKEWGKLTFDDIAKKQFELLEQRKIEVEAEIKKLMAETTKINWRLCAFEEYFSIIDGINEETEEFLENEYIEQIVDKWNEKIPKNQGRQG